MDIKELFFKINLQEEVAIKTLKIIEENYDELMVYVDDLITIDTSESTFLSLEKKYSYDSLNYYIFAIYMLSCLKVYDKYKELNIDEDIFIDTMKCFSRFIEECMKKTGKYYFDRTWWTYRQVRMSEFRIGELEYEFDYNDKVISIHIPSDAKLSKINIEKSFDDAIDFINKYFPLYKDWPMICESWLLSPNLKKYLNSNSNILLFQSYFDITNIHENDTSFFEWLFNVNGVIDYDKLNAKTSLQINVKNALINNEKIGSAFGKLNYKKKE